MILMMEAFVIRFFLTKRLIKFQIEKLGMGLEMRLI